MISRSSWGLLSCWPERPRPISPFPICRGELMAAKILHATCECGGIYLLVHLDTAMTVGSHECHELSLPEGAPHPHFVRQYHWPHRTPGVHQQYGKDMTDAEYLEMIENDLKQRVALELQGIRFYQPAPKAH